MLELDMAVALDADVTARVGRVGANTRAAVTAKSAAIGGVIANGEKEGRKAVENQQLEKLAKLRRQGKLQPLL